MTRTCYSAWDSREADDPSSMAPGFYAFPHEDYDRAPVGPFPTYAEAVATARAAEANRSNARPVLAPNLFTRPYADLDDVQARIGAAVAFIVDRIAGKAVPEALDTEITFARGTLDDLAAIKGPKRRAAAFREEHGIETMKDLWFVIANHGPLLGLSVVTSAEAAR